MSIHLVECAARLDLPASTKLALMAFADSADRVTRVAFPGMKHVQQWSGLGRSRSAEVVADLVGAGLLVKHRGGAWGRRAEYIVFPQGCCEAHTPIPADEEVQASDTPDPDNQGETGSGAPDSASVRGSTPADPTTERPQASGMADAERAPGSDTGSDGYRTPPETPTTPGGGLRTQPQTARDTPPAEPADSDEHGPLHPTCPEHRHAPSPPPCRTCAGWRTEFDAAELARAAAAERTQSAQLLEDERRARARAAHVDTSAEVSKVRNQIRPTTGART